uniref:Uncharacterized protein n=1 Tax=Anopheles quadriannulatus TaxID=34691 RepID=A0A904A5K4_ANOQN
MCVPYTTPVPDRIPAILSSSFRVWCAREKSVFLRALNPTPNPGSRCFVVSECFFFSFFYLRSVLCEN